MRHLTKEERHLMRHALGLTLTKNSYRNRFATSGRDEAWEGLCAIGAADRDPNSKSTMWVYWVTRDGCSAVIEPDETIDRETAFDHAN